MSLEILEDSHDAQHFDRHRDGVAFEGDELVPICRFDYDQIDRNLNGEPTPDEQPILTRGDAAALLARLFDWVMKGESLTHAGARAATIAWWLHGEQGCGFSNLTDIAKAAGVTKACTSKWLIQLQDLVGLTGFHSAKIAHARETYSKVQKAIYKYGVRKPRRSNRVEFEAAIDR